MVYISIETRVYKITDKEYELLNMLSREACRSNNGDADFHDALKKIESNNKIKFHLTEGFRYP